MLASCCFWFGSADSIYCCTKGCEFERRTLVYISLVTCAPCSFTSPYASLYCVVMRSASGKPLLGMPSLRAPASCGFGAFHLFWFRAQARLCCRKCIWFVVPGSLHNEELPLEVRVSWENSVICVEAVVPVLPEAILWPSIHMASEFGSASPGPRFFCICFRLLLSKTSMGFAKEGSLDDGAIPLGVKRGGPLRGSSTEAAWAAAALLSRAAE
mmetsp:Transcript_88211/g.224584  ORF Transcript_88211/g.224584 Transcript_88211/m.224584 type:complete len:213 (-) Transcript_88211:310-948(-)